MKSIWILNHYAKPYEGRHYKFAENLTKRGYKVTVFAASTIHNADKNLINSRTEYLKDEYNGIPFVFIRARNYIGNGKQRILNMIDYAKGLVSVCKKIDIEKPEAILASSVHPLTWISGYLLSRKFKTKFFVETRDLWPETLVAMGQITKNSVPAKVLYSLERFMYKKADKLIFTFPGGKDYVESIGLKNRKVVYINNGIDLAEFNDYKTRYIFKDDDLENKCFRVIYTGSMGQANALNYLVDAAKLIESMGIKDIKFILFGDGYQKKELEDFVEKYNISNVVFKDNVEKKYIPNILSRSNLNIILGQPVYLYKYGLSPNKLFDYFASGIPTLSNMECGYDILEEYSCGITVKSGSTEEVVNGILKFYNMSEEEYSNYSSNALRAAHDFDFNKLTDRLEKCIIED